MKVFTSLMLLILGVACAASCSRAPTAEERQRLQVVGEAPPQIGSQPKPAALRGDGYVYTDSDGPNAVVTLATGGASAPTGTGTMLQYDPTTEVTINGAIVGKREVRIAGDEENTALVIRVQREGEIVPVYIAPTKWLSGKGIKISVASRITVTGSQAVINGEETIMARTLNMGYGDVDLRAADGSPDWNVPTY